MGKLVVAAISLGSNLGDRRGHLDFAVSELRTFLGHPRVSTYYETEPVGTSVVQPLFLNAAAVGETTLSARDLLNALRAVEDARQRQRPYPNAPRTLDLDLILFGDSVIEEAGLVVPHPRFRERRFVLEPLAEIAPDLIDPRTGASIADLRKNA
ncbi:MAG: 2-amino-4-hydroxy-6-hydroxymethyldihydropteridine diphosphokinase [Acidobacteria bacterium]|nr:2-amino-4-hydroxy-6-hydroxymethyldihydropteridine diphosphokinase [Acidobacteriota bacterium]